jgi:hypothetical protein
VIEPSLSPIRRRRAGLTGPRGSRTGIAGSRSTCPTRRRTRSWRSPRPPGRVCGAVLDGTVLGRCRSTARRGRQLRVHWRLHRGRAPVAYLYQDPIRSTCADRGHRGPSR